MKKVTSKQIGTMGLAFATSPLMASRSLEATAKAAESTAIGIGGSMVLAGIAIGAVVWAIPGMAGAGKRIVVSCVFATFVLYTAQAVVNTIRGIT